MDFVPGVLLFSLHSLRYPRKSKNVFFTMYDRFGVTLYLFLIYNFQIYDGRDRSTTQLLILTVRL